MPYASRNLTGYTPPPLPAVIQVDNFRISKAMGWKWCFIFFPDGKLLELTQPMANLSKLVWGHFGLPGSVRKISFFSLFYDPLAECVFRPQENICGRIQVSQFYAICVKDYLTLHPCWINLFALFFQLVKKNLKKVFNNCRFFGAWLASLWSICS